VTPEPLEPLTPERRRAMTRRYLLDAAAVVFARDGFHGATLDKVASLAGFTKGAVYSNFKNKEDLFFELIDERIERALIVLTDLMEHTPRTPAQQLPTIQHLLHEESLFWDETWQTLYLEFVVYARRNPAAREKLAARAERERAVAQRFIEDEYAKRGAEPPSPPVELAKVTMAMFSGLSLDSLIDPDSVSDTTFETALSLLYRAMEVGHDPEPTEPPSSKPARAPARTRARATAPIASDGDGSQRASRAKRR
jgi:AcrR family transcriptional regulator